MFNYDILFSISYTLCLSGTFRVTSRRVKQATINRKITSPNNNYCWTPVEQNAVIDENIFDAIKSFVTRFTFTFIRAYAAYYQLKSHLHSRRVGGKKNINFKPAVT